VFGDTGIHGTLNAGANDISFTAALAGIGARVVGGSERSRGSDAPSG